VLSKLASSPTKYAEYLACGLPLIINAGVGDLMHCYPRGHRVMVESLTSLSMRDCSRDRDSVSEPDAMRARTREIAERLFDCARLGVDRYTRLYEKSVSE